VLVCVDADAKGVRTDPQAAMVDGIWSVVTLDAVPGTPIARDWTAVDAGLTRAAMLTAAWCGGAAQRLLDDTVEYVTNRVQFGVPIGSFQAVQHSLATCDIIAAEARTLAQRAADALTRGTAESRRLASTAFVRATRGLLEVSRRCHQAWGGMGYTTEAHVHHFSRRAKMVQHSWGGAEYHTQTIARELKNAPLLRDRYVAALTRRTARHEL